MSSEGPDNAGGESIASSLMKEFSTMKDKLKIKEEDWECECDAPIHHVAQTKDRYNHYIHTADSPFDGIEKATVLQDAKNFNVSKFVTGKPQECCQVRQI